MAARKPSFVKRLRQEAPVLTLALVAALALVGFFAVRLALGALYWGDPEHRDVPLAGWMSPRFVAMSWNVPPELVGQALELPRDGSGRRVTLQQLAEERGVPLGELIGALDAAIAAHREAHP